MTPYFYRYLAFFILALLASFLYAPFLSNGLIFDDHGLFSTGVIYDFAQKSFDFKSRTFPYFTLGFVSVLGGAIEVNRIVSLIIHIFCGWILYSLLRGLLHEVLNRNEATGASVKHLDLRLTMLALIGAAWFVIHPIAVYGAGYLAQRTILFATLFSLLSLWFYRRAFVENRTLDIVTAALFYSAAVFSKEHAIMLPMATIGLTALYGGSVRLHLKRIAFYFLLCFPAALTVMLASKHIVSTSYEPDVAAMIPHMHISFLSTSLGQWLVSISVQTGLFFKYIAFWLAPDVRQLSADMRVDFSQIWLSWKVLPVAFIFFLSPIIAFYLLRKKGLIALFCCGFLYAWFLFLTELVAVRFQEPFVLYRSYIWAPGYALMLVALLGKVQIRWAALVSAPIFILFIVLARDRLSSMASESVVWKDAAAKLKSDQLPGSDRIFYNRGSAYLREKKFNNAVDDFSRALRQSPNIFQIYYQRGRAYYGLGEMANAASDFDHALTLNDRYAAAYYARGMIYERNSCFAQANKYYVRSKNLGLMMAKLKIDDINKKREGFEHNSHECDDR